MIIITHNKDNEVVMHIEVVIVVITEVVIVELIEIINNNKYKMQMLLMLHHRQIQIDVIEVLLILLDNNKNNGMLEIGMVKHLFILEQLKMMNNHQIQRNHLEVHHSFFLFLFF
jgi:hypothetical protein